MTNHHTKTRFNKVLIIDDDEFDIYLASRVIKSSGFASAVIPATSVNDGIEYIRQSTISQSLPEYIFLDLNMPGKSGLDFLHEFEQLSANHKLPVKVVLLINVVNASDDVTEQAKKHPAINAVLEKPLSEELLKSL